MTQISWPVHRVKIPGYMPDTGTLDFGGYCITWHDCVHQHHHYEETQLFRNINRAAGNTGLMSTAVEEHGGAQSARILPLEPFANTSSRP
ncbi:hypothetical protein F5883DRAFT_647421 [Diaporthe sp. PMI_573]|nr:hypothetical protein F5883DRAFT_647421 [Diaporthaceae sp. PMI_573]